MLWLESVNARETEQIPIPTNHLQLTLVDHKDFIPEKYLPFFSSEAIESFIPYIPGLSEHFLFANDLCIMPHLSYV